jgi:Sigma-70 region 2
LVSISNARKKKRTQQCESPNNLSQFRWNHELPGPDEDEELVRLARTGDRKAGAQIVENYHRLIVGLAGKHKIGYQARRGRKQYTNGARDDLIGRGFEALWRAVLSWEPSRGRFSSYARRCNAGQISKEAIAFIKRGSVGETRIERWLFSHPRATPKELVAALKKKGIQISSWAASYEIQQFKARCSWHRYEPPSDYVDEPM